jgi:hypothetical protein
MKLREYRGFELGFFYLNTSDLCIEAHPEAKSTLGEPAPCSTVAELDANFWGLAAIPGAQLAANQVQ